MKSRSAMYCTSDKLRHSCFGQAALMQIPIFKRSRRLHWHWGELIHHDSPSTEVVRLWVWGCHCPYSGNFLSFLDFFLAPGAGCCRFTMHYALNLVVSCCEKLPNCAAGFSLHQWQCPLYFCAALRVPVIRVLGRSESWTTTRPIK